MTIRTQRCAVHALAAMAMLAALPARASQDNPDPDPATGLSYNCEVQLGLRGCATLDALIHQGVRPVPKPGAWGAIAAAPNLDWSYSYDFKTRKEAEASALAACTSRFGAVGCKIVVDAPGYCVALAMSDAEKISAVGNLSGAIELAEEDAKGQCAIAGGKACAIAISVCGDGVRHTLPPGYKITPVKKP